MINEKEKIIINLKKAESLIRKIMKMIEEDRYCIDIMQQNAAVMGILKSVHHMLMENHLSTCFKDAMAAKNEKKKKEMIKEILRVSKLVNK